MITGRGPGAPSVTPDMVVTLHRADRSQTADLSAIRRTDALIDLLASRRLLRPRALGDPVLELLSSLTADVDGSLDAAARWRKSPAGRAAAARLSPGGLRTVPAGPGRPAAGPARPPAAAVRPPAGPGRPAAPGGRYYGAHRRHGGLWVRAVSGAVALVAMAVTTAGLLAVAALARLSSITARGRTGA